MNKSKLVILASLLVASGLCYHMGAIWIQSNRLERFNFVDEADTGNRVHFLNVGNADAILLESEGHCALIDAGEDSAYPIEKPWLDYPGYEDEVISYVKQVCPKQAGKTQLDFVVATHAHSDHIGGFAKLASDPSIAIEKAYVKAYDASTVKSYERERWDNQEVYDAMIAAFASQSTQVVTELEEAMQIHLGSFSIAFYNTQQMGTSLVGENEQSLGLLVDDGNHSIFLAGDINNFDGDETQLAKQLPKVSILKLGHHGGFGSTTSQLLAALQPNIAIQMGSNTLSGIVRNRLSYQSKATVLSSVDLEGIVITLLPDEIQVQKGMHLHPEK
ncbi:MAG: ComEC/Rec2 family competence protein [Erysipelotrichaceae bacterium]